jgi:hypothetical protein
MIRWVDWRFDRWLHAWVNDLCEWSDAYLISSWIHELLRILLLLLCWCVSKVCGKGRNWFVIVQAEILDSFSPFKHGKVLKMAHQHFSRTWFNIYISHRVQSCSVITARGSVRVSFLLAVFFCACLLTIWKHSGYCTSEKFAFFPIECTYVFPVIWTIEIVHHIYSHWTTIKRQYEDNGF